MSSQNKLHESIQLQQTEPDQTTQSQKPPSSLENSQESKKTKPGHESESAHEHHENEGKLETTESDGTVAEDDSSSGREKLKRHRVEMSGRVWIPDMWGQEDLLKDWVDCAAFDAKLASSSIVIARDSLKEEGRRPNSIIDNAELVVVNLFD